MTAHFYFYIGDRVVVRYLLGADAPADWRGDSAGHVPTQSDVTGLLVSGVDGSGGEPLVLDRDGERVSIPQERVTSVRQLSYRAVRNKEIRALEAAAADAWPGFERAEIDGWLVRAGGGVTRRANSALPLAMPSNVSAFPALRAWFEERGLPPLVAVPDRLLGPREVPQSADDVQVHVLVRDLAGVAANAPDPRVRFVEQPSDEWLRAYRGQDVDVDTARRVVTAVHDGEVCCAEIVDDSGKLAAIGRGAVTTAPDGVRWLGVTALWTAPEVRQQRLGTAMMDSLTAWGTVRGATQVYVQAEATNRLAGNWYRRAGFGLHHTYRYVRP